MLNDIVQTNGVAVPVGPKRHLLHLLPENGIGSMTLFPLNVIRALGEYQHTAVILGEPQDTPWTLFQAYQKSGAQFLHAEHHTPELCDSGMYTAALAYDVPYAVDTGLPTLYFPYSRYCPEMQADAYIAASEWSADKLGMERVDFCIPPAIQSRGMRGMYRHKGHEEYYTVCVMSSGRNGRYPAKLLEFLHAQLPADFRLVVVGNKAWTPPAPNTRVWVIPHMVDSIVRGCHEADLLIYAHDESYTPIFGRQLLELMASGVPVLCERRGAPAALYQDNVELMFYDKQEELPSLIQRLRNSPELGRQLGANAQLRAGWADITIHAGTIKRMLYALGA